ncbi:hypothetical protein MSC49_18570 [Methylosinus sp. C49]|uniref:hypothetical protein n=1 Tax=Methylosinus sp. C49 TaxID=2699395 RepID=UPI0013678F78|nr:hypothetical protein [Methylosinus sp. C49]BBU61922.1 hypothetical protein MSC49_18570 [Methylosinus sp. C49]
MMNTADIDASIRNREAQVEELRRQLELAEAELKGMKTIRAAIGRSAHPHQPSRAAAVIEKVRQAGYSGGRQPGAISRPWRMIYSDMYHGFPNAWFSEQQLTISAFNNGIKLRPKEAKDRLSAHAMHRIVEQAPDSPGYWRVTEEAARKFGFDKEPLKNEAPSAEASGPQESLGTGDQTGAD